jgi:hypothetical protein
MAKFLLPVARPSRPSKTRFASSVSAERRQPPRAGHIGPIRREIIFEPLHEQPAPAEPAPVEPAPGPPEKQPQEPVPEPT